MLKNALFLFIAASLILASFIPSYHKQQSLRKKNTELQDRIVELETELAGLKQEKTLLEDDPVYLERVAREKMGIVREGETVFRILPEDLDNSE